MKNSLLLLFAFFTFSFTFGQAPNKNKKAVITTAIYCDHCKECETCGKNFQANMLKIKGLKMYELDATKMTITVYYNEQKTNLQAIRTAISKLGYDADDVKADQAAYERLDGCCKKS
ncbi:MULTISPECIES: cation transporter [unclassified Flavobacterium]|uniref:cation transporter n=1 Tax=unclassified Flavobacterium TaxID=196869 RepID=UPI003609E1CF